MTRIHRQPHLPRKLVFRNQAAGQQQRVARHILAGSGNDPPVFVHAGDGYPGHPVGAVNPGNGVTEAERNIKILQALHNVPVQAAGIRHQLAHHLHLGALERHPPRHNQADIPRTQNHRFLPGISPFRLTKRWAVPAV